MAKLFEKQTKCAKGKMPLKLMKEIWAARGKKQINAGKIRTSGVDLSTVKIYTYNKLLQAHVIAFVATVIEERTL